MINLNKKEQERKRRIEVVRLQVDLELKKKSSLNAKEFININCAKMGVSKRIFREYLDIALTMCGGRIKKGEIQGK